MQTKCETVEEKYLANNSNHMETSERMLQKR